MTDLWWLQPDWKNTRCACGVNIWNSGGDPDWGECYECKSARHQCAEEIPGPMCDVCGQSPAVTGVNGKGVCSEECCRRAEEPERWEDSTPIEEGDLMRGDKGEMER